MQNTAEIMKTNLILTYRTNNVIVDTLVSGIIISVMASLFQYFEIWKQKLNQFIEMLGRQKGVQEVELVRKDSLDTNSCSYSERNEKFEALLEYMKEHSMKDSLNRVYQCAGRNFWVKDLFMPEQDYHVQLTKDFSCYLQESEETHTQERGTVIITTRRIILYSKTRSAADILDWLDEQEKAYNKRKEEKENKHRYFMNFVDTHEDHLRYRLYQFSTTRSFDNVFFQGKQALVDHLKFFLNNREWYLTRGIAHKVCYLFYGSPGCGKTSTIKAIASFTDRHIVNVNLSKVKTGKELFNIFFQESFVDQSGVHYDMPLSKRIYLLEDVDAMDDIVLKREAQETLAETESKGKEEKKEKSTDGEESKEEGEEMGPKNKSDFKKDPLTLSTILNILDGLLELSEQIIILTTNYPDKLDKALVRPGRVDMHVNFTKCDDPMTREIMQLYFEEYPNHEGEFPKEVYSPAEMLQLCFQSTSLDDAVRKAMAKVDIKAVEEEDDTSGYELARCGSSAADNILDDEPTE